MMALWMGRGGCWAGDWRGGAHALARKDRQADSDGGREEGWEAHTPLSQSRAQGFFHNTPVDNLSALRDFTPFIAEEIILKEYGDDDICIVSPDAGGVARAKQFLEALGKSYLDTCTCTLSRVSTHTRLTGRPRHRCDEQQQHFARHHSQASIGSRGD